MKIVHIQEEEYVRKTPEEIEEERKLSVHECLIDPWKKVPLKEPRYVVEMSMEELQLVSFYLELEKRNPIIDINIKDKEEDKPND